MNINANSFQSTESKLVFGVFSNILVYAIHKWRTSILSILISTTYKLARPIYELRKRKAENSFKQIFTRESRKLVCSASQNSNIKQFYFLIKISSPEKFQLRLYFSPEFFDVITLTANFKQKLYRIEWNCYRYMKFSDRLIYVCFLIENFFVRMFCAYCSI